jgi:hypothetical protein
LRAGFCQPWLRFSFGRWLLSTPILSLFAGPAPSPILPVFSICLGEFMALGAMRLLLVVMTLTFNFIVYIFSVASKA